MRARSCTTAIVPTEVHLSRIRLASDALSIRLADTSRRIEESLRLLHRIRANERLTLHPACASADLQIESICPAPLARYAATSDIAARV